MEDEIPFLIFAKRRAIHRINLELNGTNFDTISRFPVNAVAIDFDIRYIQPGIGPGVLNCILLYFGNLTSQVVSVAVLS